MAEEQKNVKVPQETKPETTPAPATETPAVESKPPEETPAESAPATEDKPAEESKPAETEESKAQDKKEEVKPVDVEEGHLGHKAQGLIFPKNLIASKEFLFFGTDAFEPKALAHYLKTEKSAETAHSNIAWASHTGQGLLFVGDKKNPFSIISLADATEPETDGRHKFHFTSKGNKHSFKAADTAERDKWVAQLKLKIAEAKELAATVTESEAYKKTIESFKPAPPKKEKATETPKKEAKAEESAPAPATEETRGSVQRKRILIGLRRLDRDTVRPTARPG
ncbi:Pleckstrin homology domain-containing protein [Dactylonectria macrodidyma]|uniref:Pleckstrin homology domain-containing protein n=1 Tax=Dactylonectria macrodidyma TaxID=307937 RepID=A0A9P9EVQ0_9HYPO|nr:Pleckstrin homology domain-containing protein [Dactylonectria macrodidyma]